MADGYIAAGTTGKNLATRIVTDRNSDEVHNEVVEIGMDYLTRVTMGLIPGHSILRGLGEIDDTTVTVGGEDITRMGELNPSPTSTTYVPTPDEAGEQMTLVSESTADNSTGSGGATVRVVYIDAAGAEQNEVVTLNGRTGVNTVATDIRFVQELNVVSLGSANTSGVAAGPIKIYKTGTTGLVYNMIAATGNMSLVPHRMVPAGKTLHLKMWACTESRGKRTAIRLRADCNHLTPPTRQAGVFLFKSTMYLNKMAAGDIDLAYTIPSLSIVKASCFSDQVDADASVHWWGVLIDDEA